MAVIRKLSGKLIDAQGRVGTIEVHGDESDPNSAHWTVELASRTKPESLKGSSRIKIEGERMEMAPRENEKGAASWKAELKKYNAGSYAATAYMGQYSVQQPKDNSLMTSGVIVLWEFK